MQIFPPLPNKLAPTLNAAQTVSIFPKPRFDSGVNFGRGYSFLVEKTHNYSVLIVHRELKMLNVYVFLKTISSFSLNQKDFI
jgi:hypothetical protein